ncbi:DNA recombination protein RecN [Gordoniibacillus kamchatkensis]|uniref:DNA repair protein RecN n=1 Tax=Gordoniibacillus kamchatkensis TaxID=1590651 RepID=A0ABR5AC85_9BACL|nr:DNA repair protein RecN [Paenibacillus sp. VKM B-2647]KIL38512.1 DNA recombination protein RecN [Paenibacillus sp. VKM B-2647]
MLSELSIRNLAVIEHVHLHFKQGFHVLTGETGAGKSIIIDALSLVIGGRGTSELVRHGCDKAEIEAMFDLPADHPVWQVLERLGIEGDASEPLLIRRDITAQGKSASRVNGQMVNLSMLRDIGALLVNIHGQHEHQSLLDTEEHLHLLDLYGDTDIATAKQAYTAAYEAYMKVRKELQEIETASQQSLQMLDLYRFQIDEIASAKLKEGEDASLSEEKRKLANAEKLFQNVSDAYEQLYGAGRGLDAASKAAAKLRDAAVYDAANLNGLVEQIESAFYQLEDAAYQLRDYRDNIEFNPGRLDEIESRLDLIASLRRKYGDTVSDILAYLERIEREVTTIEHKDDIVRKLQQEAQQLIAELGRHARELSDRRHGVAARLASAIEAELRDLHMERTKFEVALNRAEDARSELELNGAPVKFGKDGVDQAEFLMAPNPGEPLRGLGKIASGGELSRIMLALKTIFARVDRIPVLVFDEVDTGVSGRAAQAIAEKLSRLSRSCQVFSITHLPQVACMADVHFSIRKEVEGGRTFTKVADVSGQDRAEELARMLGGVEITETTLHHAREMLSLADSQKAKM